MEPKYFVEDENFYNVIPDVLIKYIDTNYKKAKEMKMSRMDIRWGVWSGAMNRMIRKIQDNLDADDHKMNFEIAFAYWQLKSQLLELYYRRWMGVKFLWDSKIKKKQKELEKFRKAQSKNIPSWRK